MTTKAAFLIAYRKRLAEMTDPRSWTDPELDRFMDSVLTTITTDNSPVNLLSEKAKETWRAIGCKGALTYKGIRALPDGDIPAPTESVLRLRAERAAKQAAEHQRSAELSAQVAAKAAAELEQAAADFKAGKQISGALFEALLRKHEEEVPIQLIGFIRKRILLVSTTHTRVADNKSKSPVPDSFWRSVHRLKEYLDPAPAAPVDPEVAKLFTLPCAR